MALVAGLIPYGEAIIAVGGTGRGVDKSNHFKTRTCKQYTRYSN